MLTKLPDNILTTIWQKVPLSIREHIMPGSWLAGGAIRDLIIGEVPVDWDIFKTGLMKARQLITTYDGLKIDSVTLPVPVLERVKEFDYRCCMVAIGRTLQCKLLSVMDSNAYEDIVNRRLVVNPQCVYFGKLKERMEKFVVRGWTIDKENQQLVNLLYAISTTRETTNSYSER